METHTDYADGVGGVKAMYLRVVLHRGRAPGGAARHGPRRGELPSSSARSGSVFFGALKKRISTL